MDHFTNVAVALVQTLPSLETSTFSGNSHVSGNLAPHPRAVSATRPDHDRTADTTAAQTQHDANVVAGPQEFVNLYKAELTCPM